MAAEYQPEGLSAGERKKRILVSPKTRQFIGEVERRENALEEARLIWKKAIFQRIEEYRQAYPKNVEFGRMVGAFFIFTTMMAVGRSNFREERIIKRLRELQNVFEAKLGERDFLITRAGFMAELAVMKALADKIAEPSQVYWANREEDLKHGFDLVLGDWSNSLSSPYFAIQVKSLPERNLSGGKSLIQTFHNVQEIQTIADEYLDYHQDSPHFIGRGAAALDFCNQYDNIVPVYFFVPNTGDPKREWFSKLSGEPAGRLTDTLKKEVKDKLSQRR